MKKINLLLLVFVGAVVAVAGFNWQYASETIIFYGFAENKELKINLEHPVTIKAMHVIPGQRVVKGDKLLEVSRSGMALSQSDLNHDISKLQSQYQMWESGLKSSIRSLKAQRNEKKNELQNAISKLDSEMRINESLIKDIESITQVKDQNGKNPSQIRLAGLKNELNLSMQSYDAEIRKIERELYNSENPLKIQVDKLKEELSFVNQEQKDLIIVTPNSGIIGNINCKVGEKMPSFSTILTIYEETPTEVKGYVLESLILKVNQSDSIQVQSVSHPEMAIKGIVTGMGSRIVEIPPRLRKNPNFITYGREIQIQIPSNNDFLQKEKVILKTLKIAQFMDSDKKGVYTKSISNEI